MRKLMTVLIWMMLIGCVLGVALCVLLVQNYQSQFDTEMTFEQMTTHVHRAYAAAVLFISVGMVATWSLFIRSRSRRECTKHQEGPEIVRTNAHVARLASEIYDSHYVAHVQKLLPCVKGCRVSAATSGNRGFILQFENHQWVVAFIDNGFLEYKVGVEPIDESIGVLLNSDDYGDALKPVPKDLPYASEPCHVSAEVAKSVGKLIEGVSIGENCFNFCFPSAMELDTSIVTDALGRSTLRVFWEQW